jgi:hypothetical protein
MQFPACAMPERRNAPIEFSVGISAFIIWSDVCQLPTAPRAHLIEQSVATGAFLNIGDTEVDILTVLQVNWR